MTYFHLTRLSLFDNLYPSIQTADELQINTRKRMLRKDLLRSVLKVNNYFLKMKS